jgi:hypothetical protein
LLGVSEVEQNLACVEQHAQELKVRTRVIWDGIIIF